MSIDMERSLPPQVAAGPSAPFLDMNPEPILVVDDNPQIRRAVRTILISQGFVVMDARSGEEALDLIRKHRLELILLDVNLPGMSGIETCREIRRASRVPIIMLTVRDSERDKVQAFDAGADDYMVKPFGAEELTARVRATLRRSGSEKPATFVAPGLQIDFERRTVSAKGRVVRLTPKEFELLRQLVTNQGKTLTHRWLLQTVWGPDYGEEMESLRVLINQLRKKIEPDLRKPRYILTEPWVGYRFESPKEK
ncbi:MAG TPA: response regulator transcription factor [Candidatus Acidoferrum sp.]|nr:response regulator transcription factor [Candidatus Acidoferrum sp.]